MNSAPNCDGVRPWLARRWRPPEKENGARVDDPQVDGAEMDTLDRRRRAEKSLSDHLSKIIAG